MLQQEILPSLGGDRFVILISVLSHHYHFIITRDGRYHIGKCGWFTEDDLRPSCDHTLWYDHPELWMIDYHPGNVDGLSQPACCV